MSVLQKLTEGVQSRDMQAEGQALLNKWEATGLLEGLNDGQAKQGMAVLLENQAKELLREASSMAAGDVEGFAAVAFPIVRRVFGGLIANDLVSVQPMSLPSGLIFFLDFTHAQDRLGAKATDSVYGGNVVGAELVGGVDLGDQADDDAGAGGHYNLGHGLSAPTGSASFQFQAISGARLAALGGAAVTDQDMSADTFTDAMKKAIRFDADLLATGGQLGVYESTTTVTAGAPNLDRGKLSAVVINPVGTGQVIRRLTRIIDDRLIVVLHDASDDGAPNAATVADLDGAAPIAIQIPLADAFTTTGLAAGAVAGVAPWGLEEPSRSLGGPNGAGNAKASGEGGTMQDIPEIDIKVDSIAVTAQTKKLKAKWTPELGQDLNAYHNLDAEVELTGILSEQIALEIDRELLGELVNGATAGTRYWSRAPGLFVDANGNQIGQETVAPDFTGTVSEWYETLVETINDVSAQIHRKTLRGGANFVVCSPEVANVLEFTSGFRASVTADQDRGTIGAVKAGSLSKKFDVYVDPYFLRNVVLVGRKGSSFLESGFVYAPYVPLQVTPTIFGTEDFVPRKGVMTRYAKKMVRPDMYGLVVVRGLLGESGS